MKWYTHSAYFVCTLTEEKSGKKRKTNAYKGLHNVCLLNVWPPLNNKHVENHFQVDLDVNNISNSRIQLNDGKTESRISTFHQSKNFSIQQNADAELNSQISPIHSKPKHTLFWYHIKLRRMERRSTIIC